MTTNGTAVLAFELMVSPFPEITAWGAIAGRYTFVISSNQDGYTASFKDQDDPIPKQATRIGEYAGFRNFAEAERACRDQLNRMRQ